MKNIYNVVKYNQLFYGIGDNDFEKMLYCMGAKIKGYDKGDIILLAGDKIYCIGLVVSGSVRVIEEDEKGNTIILAEIAAPEMFGEVFACVEIDHSPVTVQASEKCDVLFVNYRKAVTSCSSACGFHSLLIANMLKIIAQKNLLLNKKIDILSKRTTRDKLLAFFDAYRGDAKQFTVPFNREEMACYLCVDRSAMSYELCKMRDEGLIKFNRNAFEIGVKVEKT